MTINNWAVNGGGATLGHVVHRDQLHFMQL